MNYMRLVNVVCFPSVTLSCINGGIDQRTELTQCCGFDKQVNGMREKQGSWGYTQGSDYNDWHNVLTVFSRVSLEVTVYSSLNWK